MSLNADNDFAQVVDGLQTLTLLRRGAGSLMLASARCVSQQDAAHQDAAGGATHRESVWDIPWPGGRRPPAVGDKLRDSSGSCGAIVEVSQMGPGTRFRCRTSMVAIATVTASLVEIQQAICEDLGGGPEIIGWKTLRPAVNAWLQPVRTEVDHSGAAPLSESRFDIYLDFDGLLDGDHRIIGPGAVEFRIDRFLAERSPGDLPVVEATRVTAPS